MSDTEAANYITAHCRIEKGIVFKNGKKLFQGIESSTGDFLLAAYRHFGCSYPKFHKMDHLSKLGWLAAELLLQNIHLDKSYRPEDIGVVLSNASGSLDTDIKYYETAKDIASPALFVYTLPNIVIGEICIRHQIKGEQAFFIFDTFDAEFIQQYAGNLINNNILQCCICGWVELLGEEYNAVLFLVEKEKKNAATAFTKENIQNIYVSENG